jgi:hypothetical protein
MKKTDAHQFIMLTLQDYLNTLPKSSQLAMVDKLKAAMDALAPVPEPELKPAREVEHG